VYFSD
jgi:phospholipid-transporting ATPase